MREELRQMRYVCNFCGRQEIAEPDSLETWEKILIRHVEYDLCPNCYKALHDKLENPSASPPPLEEVKPHIISVMPSGVKLTLTEGVPTISDIQRVLSQISRFHGLLDSPFSVLDHSIAVGCYLYDIGHPGLMLAGLLHDCIEVAIGDCPKPLKSSDWANMEDDLICRYLPALGCYVTPEMTSQWRVINRADVAIMIAEARHMGPDGLQDVPPFNQAVDQVAYDLVESVMYNHNSLMFGIAVGLCREGNYVMARKVLDTKSVMCAHDEIQQMLDKQGDEQPNEDAQPETTKPVEKSVIDIACSPRYGCGEIPEAF